MTQSQNFEFFRNFQGKFKAFLIFNIVNIQKLGFSGKLTENLSESPA